MIVCYLFKAKSLLAEIMAEGHARIWSLFVRETGCACSCFVQLTMGRLKGIPTVLSPDLLHALSSMGHGDEIGECVAISYFPLTIRYDAIHFVR